jgi:hypothetical protein
LASAAEVSPAALAAGLSLETHYMDAITNAAVVNRINLQANGIFDAVLRRQMRQEAELQELRAKATPPAEPVWNKDTGELSIGGKVAKRIKNIKLAIHVVRILDDFARDGWPPRIDDPLPFAGESERKRRLKLAVESLNDGIAGMRFHRDGSTTGIVWEKI